jgi:hypothetical protein
VIKSGEQRRDQKAKIKVQKLIKMSDKSEDEVTIRRERRLAEFLDNEKNDDGKWSPPEKVKKANKKKKREELSHRADQVTEAFIDQLRESGHLVQGRPWAHGPHEGGQGLGGGPSQPAGAVCSEGARGDWVGKHCSAEDKIQELERQFQQVSIIFLPFTCGSPPPKKKSSQNGFFAHNFV